MADRFYDKFGFQMMQQNQAFMRCPHDVKGVFLDLRMMAGNSEHEDGTIPIGAAGRATRDDLLDYLTDFDKAKRNYFEKVLKRLVAVGALEFYGKDEKARIPFYVEEQALGRTADVNRKRQVAADDLLELVNRSGTVIRGLFRSSSARGLPYEVLEEYLKGEGRLIPGRRIYKTKAQEIISRMVSVGMLLCVEGSYTLASLARPPETGTGLAGTGADFSGARKIPLESESDSESETEGLTPHSADPADARPRGPYGPRGSPAPVADGGRASEARTFVRPLGSDDPITYHEEAMTHPDPIHAGIQWLKNIAQSGWDEQGDGEKRAPSQKALLAHWKKLRDRHGPQVALRMWREALFEIMLDHRNGGKYRSWVAGFRSKLNIKSDVAESLRGAAAADGRSAG